MKISFKKRADGSIITVFTKGNRNDMYLAKDVFEPKIVGALKEVV